MYVAIEIQYSNIHWKGMYLYNLVIGGECTYIASVTGDVCSYTASVTRKYTYTTSAIEV